MTFGPVVSNFSDAIQKGYLERNFVDSLIPLLVYRSCADKEQFSGRIGETITKTKTGLIVPNITPLNPSTNTNLDNGTSPQQYSVEQYSLSIAQYPQISEDINLIDDEITIASFFMQNAKKLGIAQASTVDKLCRNALLNAYMGGNSCLNQAASIGSTTAHVDDIRGFSQVNFQGKFVNVSPSTSLIIYINGVINEVIGALPDVVNASAAYESGGISGTLTLLTGIASAAAIGDPVISYYRSPIFRPNGRSASNKLVPGDFLTMQLVRDGISMLRNNSIPCNTDGYYHMYLDATNMNQLRSDPEFQLIVRGRGTDDGNIRTGWIDPVDQVRFIQTTQAPIQSPDSFAPISTQTTVHRPMIVGGGALIESYFMKGREAMANFMPRAGDFSNSPVLSNSYMGNNIITERALEVADVSNMWLYVRPPLDRLGQIVGLTSNYIGGFTAPTDVSINKFVIDTATEAYYKRAVLFETA
jgi:hypothetical protein